MDLSTSGVQPMDTSAQNVASGRSKVMQFFTKKMENYWSCNLCIDETGEQILLLPNEDRGTTSFWRHVEKYHPTTYNDIEGISIKRPRPMEMLRSPSVSTSNPLVRGIQREKTTEEELARLIYTCDLPWSIADNENFVRWSNYCAQSQMNVPSSENCRKALLEMGERQKREVLKEFSIASRFSVTIGGWELEDDYGEFSEYIFHITIHWIDEEWKLREKVVGLYYCPDGDDICDAVIEVSARLEDYNLMNKVRLN